VHALIFTVCTARTLRHRPFTSASAQQQQHQHTTAGTKQTVAWQCGGGLCERSFNELNLLNSNYLNMQTEEPRIVQYSLVAKGRAVLFGERAAPTAVSRLALHSIYNTDICAHICSMVSVCRVQRRCACA
jgi:hypothetical protein